MLIYLRVLKESFNFAVNALKNNKLRTFLSLVGVTIGIFSIIAVLAAVDSLKKEIDGSLSSLDNSTMYLGRFSFGPTDVPRWKSEQFPDVTYEEYQYLKRSVPDVKAISYTLNVPQETMKFEDASVSNVQIGAVTHEYYEIEALDIAEGRFFNETESFSGNNVAVIGDEIANVLFGTAVQAIGKQARLYGRKFTIIGVLKKEGSSLFGGSRDTAAYIPVNAVRKVFGNSNRNLFPFIVLKPEKDVEAEEFIAMLSQKLRMARGMKPDEIDNFVSVKERTNLIGIQKSLGAKNRFILFQFLFEAVILAVIGGLIGLFLVFIVSIVASSFTGDFEFVLSPWNMFIGTAISAAIGLISGILPAISASKLDPVEAIRTGM